MNKIRLLLNEGIINPIDYYFTASLSEFSESIGPSVFLAAALASHATANKHVCLDLSAMETKILFAFPDGKPAVQCPELMPWRRELENCPFVGSPGEIKPLILGPCHRLYLFRYWQYENILANEIRNRNQPILPVDGVRLAESLQRIFPESREGSWGLQQTAAVIASHKKICFITGGPGTGKTTAVARILAVLLEQPGNEECIIRLAAPTGKAAVRLGESINALKPFLNTTASVLNAFPESPQTIHRLLQPRSGTPYFRHDRQHPLNADIVVVDEASMVDVALMAKLIEAVPEESRLILIGDKDQLASVEAGSVLGDICGEPAAEEPDRWRTCYEVIKNKHRPSMEDYPVFENDLDGCTVHLNRTYRFNRNIENLSKAIKNGDFEKTRSCLDSASPDIRMVNILSEDRLITELENSILSGYTAYLQTDDPAEALFRFGQFKILCAVNQGSRGVEGINRAVERILTGKGLIHPHTEFYPGRPILITENDYPLSLFNGDIGLIRQGNQTGEGPYACFQDTGGSIRKIQPHRLPRHETAFALTIHKSQGSEFESVLIVLPLKDTPVLTRELLYTAVTRSRSKITLWADERILKNTLARKINRFSGLSDLLRHRSVSGQNSPSNNIFR